ncbi:transketolase C-terminal domain-containing protein, partial [Rhizobium ruizarguesonis]
VLAGNADAKVTIFASGSEVEISVAARTALEAQGVTVRVVSVPCTELFFEQPEAYRKEILGNSPGKIAVEAAVREGWDAFIGPEGTVIGMKS